MPLRGTSSELEDRFILVRIISLVMLHSLVFSFIFQPRVDDYDPKVFIRCHSKKDNPGDDQTKIWACAFEPKIDKEGEFHTVVVLYC